MKVVILGSGAMLANLIRAALIADVEIVGVFRYERLIYSPVRMFIHDLFKGSSDYTLIKKHHLCEVKCSSANSEEFKRFILKNEVDIILVGTWREKLKPEIINMPKIATINVHPSLLPKYRGPNPYLQVIWHQEKKSGVTFHLMDKNFDTGPILAQAEVEILEGDTSYELKNKVVFLARLLGAELLKKLKKGPVEPTVQYETLASYYPNIKPEDMTLNFCDETAEQICAHVRAFHPFLPTYIQDGYKFYIVNPYKISIDALEGNPGEILYKNLKTKLIIVAAKDGKAVRFEDITPYSIFFHKR